MRSGVSFYDICLLREAHAPGKMRIETGVSRDGCNAKNIMRAGKKYGFEVKGFRKSLDNLLKLRKKAAQILWKSC